MRNHTVNYSRGRNWIGEGPKKWLQLFPVLGYNKENVMRRR
jgi:hypothetical protein